MSDGSQGAPQAFPLRCRRPTSGPAIGPAQGRRGPSCNRCCPEGGGQGRRLGLDQPR